MAATALLLVDDGLAQFHALATDVDTSRALARALDQRPDLPIVFPAERTAGVALLHGPRLRQPPPRTSPDKGFYHPGTPVDDAPGSPPDIWGVRRSGPVGA